MSTAVGQGHAGTGKTMLLIGLIRELSGQLAVLAPTLSYFFCQGQGKTDPPLNNATATLRSLIWMLLIQQPRLISHLQTDYASSRGAVFTDTNALVAMTRVFKDMVKDARRYISLSMPLTSVSRVWRALSSSFQLPLVFPIK
jgi:hypothetical protein